MFLWLFLQVQAQKIVTFAKNEFMWWKGCRPRGNFFIVPVSDAIIVTYYFVSDLMFITGTTHRFPDDFSAFPIPQKMHWKNIDTARKLMKSKMLKTENMHCSTWPIKNGLLRHIFNIMYVYILFNTKKKLFEKIKSFSIFKKTHHFFKIDFTEKLQFFIYFFSGIAYKIQLPVPVGIVERRRNGRNTKLRSIRILNHLASWMRMNGPTGILVEILWWWSKKTITRLRIRLPV